ncbi:MAG: 23S rRNA (guanosine(2251)-2'-O)-methyltransferase RlmB [Candidatus Aminicenantes bacterium 4484_214]|nr:23S rRNA (guanosine(2251)-2'-O)-methyltransferase RlmB [Candidatus Aminicenantes bacterium]OQX53204.1 MAG: 23S rRNA (guanosine(2251)-2'-O)-methyltransferase RlmB [Candidatus Aminicenantes bacterium 4484_214]
METLSRLNPVLEILQSSPRRIIKLFLVEQLPNPRLKQVFRLARQHNVPVVLVPRKKLDRLQPHHQGLVAWLSPKPYADLKQVLERSPCPFLVVLDSVEDPQNLGAILRSAEGGGVDAVIIPARRAAGLTEAVAAVSAGAWEHIPLCREKNLARTLAWLKEKGLWVVGAEAGAGQLWYEFDYSQPVAIVLGSEGRGLRPIIRRQCDVLLALPLLGKVSSLNVAATAAVFIYEVVRQRGAEGRE